MSCYHIYLTPVDHFFFGGDMTFSMGEKKHDEEFSSYIIKSNRFPQQTALLGMLRFLLLRNSPEAWDAENKCIKDKSCADSLIGGNSFRVQSNEADFGFIQRIGRCRILLTHGEARTTLDVKPLWAFSDEWTGGAAGVYNGRQISIPDMPGYNAKDGLEHLFTDGYGFDYDEDIIFRELTRVGIDRSIMTGKVEENAFFKQVSYQFNDTDRYYWRFTFDAEIEGMDGPDGFAAYSGQLVSIGADNSWFRIQIEAFDGPFTQDDVNHPVSKSVSLLSPAYLEEKDLDYASFGVTELIPFRFIKTTTSETNYYANPRLRSNEKYNLYAPGSVFCFESEKKRDAFIDRLKSYRAFRQIGYNEYK